MRKILHLSVSIVCLLVYKFSEKDGLEGSRVESERCYKRVWNVRDPCVFCYDFNMEFRMLCQIFYNRITVNFVYNLYYEFRSLCVQFLCYCIGKKFKIMILQQRRVRNEVGYLLQVWEKIL